MSIDQSQNLKKEQAFSLYRAGQLLQARDVCQTLCNTESSDPDIWCLLTAIYGDLKLYEDAEQCGQRAIDLAPENISACLNTAIAQFNLNKFNVAMRGFQNVLQHRPDHWVANFLMGQCYELQVDQDQKAMASYERALSQISQPPSDIVVKLATFYERVGVKDKACRLVDNYLATHPNDPDPAVELIKARMDENEGCLDISLRRLEKLLHRDDLSQILRSHALNRVGLVLDRLGEYKRAYDAFKESQRIVREKHSHSSGGYVYDRIYRNMAVTTPDNVSNWRQNTPNDDLPSPVFLLGFNRSGTTLLERVISAHPEVVPSSEETLLHETIRKLKTMSDNRLGYPYNLNELTSEQVTILRQEYWGLARNRCGASPNDKLFLDKLPLNTIELCFINRIFPESDILFLLRDPRDVCLSCFMQKFDENDGNANFYDLMSAARFYDSTMSLFSHYEATLDLNIFKLRYEDLVSDFERQVRKILNFLHLDWDERVMNYTKNRKYKILTPSYHDTCKPIFTSAVGRWKHYEDYMQPAMPFLQSHIEKFGYNAK